MYKQGKDPVDVPTAVRGTATFGKHVQACTTVVGCIFALGRVVQARPRHCPKEPADKDGIS